MPIYEYKCEHCQKIFEALQKFSDDPLTECMLCHEGPVKKLISASAFVLKGPGFYVNDYGKKGGSSSSSTSSSSSSSSASESKSDSKSPDSSASKTETKTDAKQAS